MFFQLEEKIKHKCTKCGAEFTAGLRRRVCDKCQPKYWTRRPMHFKGTKTYEDYLVESKNNTLKEHIKLRDNK